MKNKIIRIINLIFVALTVNYCTSAAQLTVKETPPKAYNLKARDLYLQGIHLQQDKRYNEALVKFYQALHHDSASAAIYSSIAENHMYLGHFESAEMLLRKALSIDSDHIEALSLMGECQLHLKHDDKAEEIYKKLLKIDPFDAESRQYLLLLYERNDDLAGIAEQNEEMLEIYGRDMEILHKLGDFYLEQKKYKRAKYFFQQAAETDSTEIYSFINLGRIAEIEQDQEQAVTHYKKALELDPGSLYAIDQLTFIYRLQRKWQEIIGLFQPLFEKDPNSEPARIYMSESYFYLEQYDKARGLLLPLIKKKRASLNVIELIARIESQAGNYPEAAKYFREIIDQQRTNKYAWLFLAFALNDMDSTKAAEQTYKDALNIFPKDADIWSFYAGSLQARSEFDQAIISYKKALSLDSANANALTSLPVIYEQLEMFSQCDSLYEAALVRLPDNDLILNNFSYSLTERDRQLGRALEMAKKAVSKKPKNAAYLDTIGWIYYKLGDFEQAEKYIKSSVELRHDSAVVLEHLGDVYLKLGNPDKAQDYWLKSLEIDNNNKVVEKLKDIK